MVPFTKFSKFGNVITKPPVKIGIKTTAVPQLHSSLKRTSRYQDEKFLQSTHHSAYLHHFTVFLTTVQQQSSLHGQ